MMRMVIGSIDYLQSLRIVARTRMLRVSERARPTRKEEDGKGQASLQFPSRGSEWGGGGYLDNIKHFIFWLCSMKWLNFRHFNTNNKDSLKLIFSQIEAKPAPKRPILFF